MENNLELKYNKLIYNYPYLKEIVSDCDESDVCTAKSLDEKIIYGIVKMVIHTILIASIAWIMSVSIYLGQVRQKKIHLQFL